MSTQPAGEAVPVSEPALPSIVERRKQVQAVLDATTGETFEVRTAALTALQEAIPPPGRRTTNRLWMVLVVGLVTTIVFGVVGLFVLLLHGSMADQIVTVVTAAITGLIGLFTPSPTGSSG